MHASMYTISRHADLCMMPITFDRVSTGSIGYIHELLTVIYGNVCVYPNLLSLLYDFQQSLCIIEPG